VQIYIDESGTFVQPRKRHRISVVGALVVPDRQAEALFRAFEELAALWRRGGQEVKGSALSEMQIACVIELVSRATSSRQTAGAGRRGWTRCQMSGSCSTCAAWKKRRGRSKRAAVQRRWG